MSLGRASAGTRWVAQVSSLLAAVLITSGLLLSWCLSGHDVEVRASAPSGAQVREIRVLPRDSEPEAPPEQTPSVEEERSASPWAAMPLPEPLEASSWLDAREALDEVRSSIDLPRAPRAQLESFQGGVRTPVRESTTSSEATRPDLGPRARPVTPGRRSRVSPRQGPYGAGEVDSGPIARGRQASPAYPARLQRRARPPEGSVTLRFVVDVQGRVRDVEVESSRGPRAFRQAAREAVTQWVFHPARKNGRAVAVRARKTFEFRGQKR
jgi:periplasmic protein TonB